jgi:hypothetical protein
VWTRGGSPAIVRADLQVRQAIFPGLDPQLNLRPNHKQKQAPEIFKSLSNTLVQIIAGLMEQILYLTPQGKPVGGVQFFAHYH